MLWFFYFGLLKSHKRTGAFEFWFFNSALNKETAQNTVLDISLMTLELIAIEVV